jgi:hypothetical protein
MRCPVEHVGIVVSGSATAEMDDGTVAEMLPRDIFYIPPGHDSWVVGTHPYVSRCISSAPTNMPRITDEDTR